MLEKKYNLIKGFSPQIHTRLRNWGSKSDPCKGHAARILMAFLTDAIVSALHENYALTCRLILSAIQGVVWLLHDDVIKRNPFPRYWPFVAYIYENLCRMLGFDPPMSGIILGMGFANERNRVVSIHSGGFSKPRTTKKVPQFLKLHQLTWCQTVSKRVIILLPPIRKLAFRTSRLRVPSNL